MPQKNIIEYSKWFQITLCLLMGLIMVKQANAITPEIRSNTVVLMDKVKESGWVRVIVRLDTPTIPEGYLTTQAHVNKQQQLIASTQSALLSRIRANDIRSVKRFKYVPLVAMVVTEKGLRSLIAASETAEIVEEAMYFPSLAQSVPLIGADNAHENGFTGQDQTIAIPDTGVDKNHPFLAGKVMSEACFSTNDPAFDLSSACPNNQSSQIGPGSGVPCAGSLCDHGTRVAGIANGGDGSFGFSGVAKGASIVAIQAMSLLNDNDICTFFFGVSAPCAVALESDVMLSMEHVFSLRNIFNIAAVNMSLGGEEFASPCDTELFKMQVDLLRSVGIPTIAGSGNSGSKSAIAVPACISSAISVGSTNKQDQVSFFSNSANFLDLLAPGELILSSIPGVGFGIASGTSFSTPHVAGAFAVLRSKNPSATIDEILAALKNTGQPVLDTGNSLIKPRIQVDLALTQITGIVGLDDIIIDFGSQIGLWIWMNNSQWVQLHSVSPEIMGTGDIDNNEKDDVIVDFGPQFGIWIWMNNSQWVQLHSSSAEIITTGDIDDNGQDDIIIDFGSQIGLWIWMNNTNWVQLHSVSPEAIVTGRIDNGGKFDVIVDFGSQFGIFIWMNNNQWVQLHGVSPETMVTGDIDDNGQDDIIIDFGSQIGLWIWMNNSQWVQLHSVSPETMVTGDIDNSGQADVIVDFGSQFGIFIWMNNSNWVQLHSVSPETMVAGNIDGQGTDDIIIDFGSQFGIWIWMNNTNWVQLHSVSPESMVTGNIDGN